MTKVKKMADLKSRILPLFRRSSGSSAKSSSSSIHSIKDSWKARSKSSLVAKAKPPSVGETVPEEALEYYQTLQPQELALASPSLPTTSSIAATHSTHSDEPSPTPQPILPVPQSPKAVQQLAKRPTVTLEEPTPDQEETHPREEVQAISVNAPASIPKQPTEEPNSSKAIETMPANGKQWPLKTLLDVKNSANQQTEPQDYFGQVSALSPKMQHRRIWVKRPGASATMVMINEGDLVDDVRDMILRKYANSLGRTFDSPDVTLRIVAREHSLSKKALGAERVLGPEESMTKTLDVYYPGGQTVDEALIIDVPQRRTPRHSPRVHGTFYAEDIRPTENAADYFPVMPMVNTGGSPHMPSTVSVAGSTASGHHHSIAILNTGQVPTLPSPGGSRSMRHSHRPKFPRNNTASPTIMNAAGSHIDVSSIHPSAAPAAPALPTPPLPNSLPQRTSTPPPRSSSPRPMKTKRTKKSQQVTPPLPALIDSGVPPINVLIVEDNIINLRLLEAFMKRLKVRWHTAMNGRDAVKKWRDGGFHLVLMDIQLPVMNGLDATKEIRRLERVNGIGVVGPKLGPEDNVKAGGEKKKESPTVEPTDDDKLKNRPLFKSSVIIVALTASSLQSDRHEALAAGCNDFLTKPVKLVWLERKVMEWGCMQALIDFDGYRQWKHFSQGDAKNSASNSVAPTPSSVATPQKNIAKTGQSKKPVKPVPETLAALNAKSDSVNTLNSISSATSTSSGSSTDTATSPRKGPSAMAQQPPSIKTSSSPVARRQSPIPTSRTSSVGAPSKPAPPPSTSPSARSPTTIPLMKHGNMPSTSARPDSNLSNGKPNDVPSERRRKRMSGTSSGLSEVLEEKEEGLIGNPSERSLGVGA